MATLDELMGRMADLGTTPPNKTLTLGLYGKPGTGKTVLATGLASYIAAGKKVLYIDTREGWVSLQNHPSMMNNVTRIQMKTFEDFGLIVQAIARGQLKDIGAVILDEGTTAADMLLSEQQHIMLGKPAEEIITEKPDWTIYRTIGDSLVQVITAFQQLHVHFILIAHEKTKEDPISGAQVAKPGYSDTINDKVSRLLHVNARLTTQIASVGPQGTIYDRIIQSHPSVRVDAKSRIGNLPVTTTPKDFTQVIHDWIFDVSRGFAPEAQALATDRISPEVQARTDNGDSDGPTMGTM